MKWVLWLFAGIFVIAVVGMFAAIELHESSIDLGPSDWSVMTLAYTARAFLLGLAVAALILLAANAFFQRSHKKNGGDDQINQTDLEAGMVANVSYLFKDALDRELMPEVKRQIEEALQASRAPADKYDELQKTISDLELRRDTLVRAQEQHEQKTAALRSKLREANEEFAQDRFSNLLDEHTTESAESGFDETAIDETRDLGK